MQVHAYLSLNGRCEEAIEFYRQALGAEVQMIMRMKESPEPIPNMRPGMENKILHASLRIGDSVLMMSDGDCNDSGNFQGFSLAVDLPDIKATRRCFDHMVTGGQVTMPLDKTFWSPCFGMLKDRFGVNWMVSVTDESAKG
ncbi:VOC family protein [Chitinimonas sp. PSY-7]|uniref:VOC family protein n=1 Tax=Chitinimonas sp. PSY-7 TaxID=3459088 RepID=UPI0040401707